MSALECEGTVGDLAFWVDGVPVPQGSKNPWGGEANPQTRPWRATVTWTAKNAARAHDQVTGPVQVRLVFVFPRPKGHFGTGGNQRQLRSSAPFWKQSKPDLDKLVRAVLDGLTDAGVWRDDSQVVRLDASKQYGDQPGVSVCVRANA